LASNTTGPSYILKYDELLFELGDTKGMANKIEKCIIDKDYYQNIRNKCSERAKLLYFDWAEQFEKAMRDYLSGNKTSDFTLY